MLEQATLGVDFARAIAEKDFDRILDLLHPEIDFRGMTPRRLWEASDAETVVSQILPMWFEDSDEIESLDKVETEPVADCERVGYRFSVRNPDGRFVVEQQAYLTVRDGRIGWMRVLCSGYRPA
jgi:ketosteroid isomerase-like protein